MQNIIDELTSLGYKVIIMPRVYGCDYYVYIEHTAKMDKSASAPLLIDALSECLALAKKQ